MFRRLVSATAALALLVQAGAGFAQAHLSPHEPASSTPATAEAALPCHGADQQAAAAAEKSTGDLGCCAGDCGCEHACSQGALPATTLDIDDFIAAHFRALRAQPSPAPAHRHKQPRPPAPQG